MTLNDVLTDFAWLSVLLLIGFQLRRNDHGFAAILHSDLFDCRTIGMLLSADWLERLRRYPFPFSSGIGQWSGVLVIVVCATMFLSLELNQVGRDGMATTFMAGVAHQGQLIVVWGSRTVRPVYDDLPYQFGFMGVWGFYAGHGNATTVGNIMQDAGLWDDAVGVGVTFATMGMLCGVIRGMIIINIGAKKGLTHVKMSFADMAEESAPATSSRKTAGPVGNGVTNVFLH